MSSPDPYERPGSYEWRADHENRSMNQAAEARHLRKEAHLQDREYNDARPTFLERLRAALGRRRQV